MAFNSNEYAYSDVKITMLDGTVLGAQSISWKVSQAKKNVYAMGPKPIKRVRGKKEFEGAIGLT